MTERRTVPLQVFSGSILAGAELGARQIVSFTHSVFILYAPGPGLAASCKSKRFDLFVSALPPCNITPHNARCQCIKQLPHQKQGKVRFQFAETSSRAVTYYFLSKNLVLTIREIIRTLLR